MACEFRRAIARRVVAALNYDIMCDEGDAVKKLLPLVKVHKRKMDQSKFILDWNEMSTLLCYKHRELTPEILSRLRGPKGFILADGLENVNILENNVVGFAVNENYFTQKVLHNMHTLGEEWKKNNSVISNLARENIVIDFSSPNVAKTFHVGHLRSTILGNAVANLHEFLNQNVTRINYLGDWGTQYGLLSRGYEKFGSEEELEKNPLEHLYSVYVASNNEAEHNPVFADEAKENFSRLEKNDEILLKRWKKFRDISIEAYQRTYMRLGVRFDVIAGESDYHQLAADIVNRLLQKGLAKRNSEGVVVVNIPYTSAPEKDVPIAKSDDSSLYISRDIAAAIDRKDKFDFNKMYYVVDNRQSDHFASLKNILCKMGYDWHSTLHHIKFGLIHGMSTRSGKAIFLKNLLDEAKVLARKNMELSPNIKVDENREEVADILGMSGLIVYDLIRQRTRDYQFSWKEALAASRDSGIALQYSHARLAGVQRECGRKLDIHCETNVLQESEALLLIHHLSRFDEVLCEAKDRLELSYLVRYLFQLSHLAGSAYKVLPVKGQDKVTAKARLLLFHCAKEVLGIGMKVIGLRPLDKM